MHLNPFWLQKFIGQISRNAQIDLLLLTDVIPAVLLSCSSTNDAKYL